MGKIFKAKKILQKKLFPNKSKNVVDNIDQIIDKLDKEISKKKNKIAEAQNNLKKLQEDVIELQTQRGSWVLQKELRTR